MTERLHPQSWRELRQLVKLHGAPAIMRAVAEIAGEPERCPKCGSTNMHKGMCGACAEGTRAEYARINKARRER